MRCLQRVVILMALVVTPVLGSSAWAKKHYVNIPSSPCGVNHTSIQDAINHAISYDIVVVGPGVYAEQLAISKSYITVRSLNGANVTIIEPPELSPAGIEITGNNNIIQGFTVRDTTVGHEHDHLLFFLRGDRNQVKNCILIGREEPNYLDTGVLIRGGGVGDGIAYANQVNYNDVSGMDQGIVTMSDAPNDISQNTRITYNKVHHNKIGIVIDRSPNCRVHYNEIGPANEVGIYVQAREKTDGTWASVSGLDIHKSLNWGNGIGIHFRSSRNARVDNYDVITGNGIGIFIDEKDGNVGTPIIYSITISGNGIGVLSEAIGRVNAKYNWWGDPGGPGADADNDGISGDTVIGNVNYTPWLTAPPTG